MSPLFTHPSPVGSSFAEQQKPTPKDIFKDYAQNEVFLAQLGFPSREELTWQMMRNDVGKIAKLVFSRPFSGDKKIKEHLFSSALQRGRVSFFDLFLEMLLYGQSKAFIVANKQGHFHSKVTIDKDGARLRGEGVGFYGFSPSLPAGVKKEEVDPALLIHLKHAGNNFPPLGLTLRPFYDYYYNLLVNINYALMVANTPQIKLSSYRDTVLGNGEQSSSSRMFSAQYFKNQIQGIKSAFGSSAGKQAVFLDAGDSIGFQLPHMGEYAQALAVIEKLIANAIDAPVSYLFGEAPKGFNATGEKDWQQWKDCGKFWYAYILAPIFLKLQDLFSLKESQFDFGENKERVDHCSQLLALIPGLTNAKKEGMLSTVQVKDLSQALERAFASLGHS